MNTKNQSKTENEKKFYLKKRGGFIIKNQYLKIAKEKLNQEEFCFLFDLIFKYHTTGEIEINIENAKVDLVYTLFVDQFEIDTKNYISMCKRNSRIALEREEKRRKANV